MTARSVFLSLCLLAIVETPAGGQVDEWQPAGIHAGQISALCADSSGYLYVGAGTLVKRGGGLYRSADGGRTWDLLVYGLPALPAYRYSLLYAGNGVLLAGLSSGNTEAENGLFRSTNGGEDWLRVESNVPIRDIESLTMDQTGRIFAGAYDGDLFRSFDQGKTFIRVQSGWGLGAIYAVDSVNRLIAARDDDIHASEDGGSTWKMLVSPVPGSDIGCLTVAKDGALLIGTSTEGAFRSTDGGLTWSLTLPGRIEELAASGDNRVLAGGWYGMFESPDCGVTWQSRSGGVWQEHATSFLVIPNGPAFLGTDLSRFYQADPSGSAWTWVADLGTANTKVRSLAVSKADGRIVASLEEYPGVYWSDDEGGAWTPCTVLGMNTMTSLSRDVFIGAYGGGVVMTSEDNGVTWTELFNFLVLPPPWPSIMSLTTDGDGILYMGTHFTGLYRSTDGGRSWHRLPDFTARGASCVTVSPRGHLFAGTWEYLFRSTDKGEHWTKHWDGLPNPNISAIGFDSSGYAYAGTWGGGVFRSSDDGDSWARVSYGRLDSLNIKSLVVSPSGDIFVGTFDDSSDRFNGVYRSGDHGETWFEANSGLANLQITCLDITAQGNVLAGTRGNGLFLLPVSGGTVLHRPTPLLPANGAASLPTRIDLAWTYVAAAQTYHLQVSGDPDFQGLVADDSSVVPTAATVVGLEHETLYWWRVRSRNATSFSAWSPVWSFTTVIDTPRAVALVAPDDGEMIGANTVPVRWCRGGSNVTAYELDIAADSLFAAPIVDSTIVDTAAVLRGLTPSGKYWWKVRAKNAAGWGPYSEVRSFRILPLPASVSLVLPADSGLAGPGPLRFVWNTCPGTTLGYRIEIADDSVFVSVRIDSLQSDTSFVTSGLPVNRWYWWRVRGKNALGWGSAGEVRRLMVLSVPEAVLLVAPADSAGIDSSSARFVWRTGRHMVNRYWFEISADSAFVFVRSDTLLTDTTTVIAGLERDHPYWWRVRAGNPVGWGSYSETRKLKVFLTPVRETEEEIPAAFSLSQNYPNPFNPSTTIRYGLPQRAHVTLTVHNTLGQLVARLVNGERDAGYHEVRFDASGISSGVYVYRLQAGSQVDAKKFLLVR